MAGDSPVHAGAYLDLIHVITRYICGTSNWLYGQMNDCLIIVRGSGTEAFSGICEALEDLIGMARHTHHGLIDGCTEYNTPFDGRLGSDFIYALLPHGPPVVC